MVSQYKTIIENSSKNIEKFLNGEIDLEECLHEHMIICFNYIPAPLVEIFGKYDIHAATLNMFVSALYCLQYDDLIFCSLHPIQTATIKDNEEGLKLLIENVKEYLNGDKTIYRCLNIHMEICHQLDDYIEYFNDGWSKDTHLNLLKYVIKAVKGDKKAYDRLIVDLGIEDCNLTIVQIK